MKAKCWNCGKMNEERPDGNFWCSCRNIPKESNDGLIYLPLEVFNQRKELHRKENQKIVQEVFK